MSVIEIHCDAMTFNRSRTLGLLDTIADSGSAEAALGWRPGSGRAPIGWQLMHIGITEEQFGTEYLRPGKAAQFEAQWSRFRGGSTPDDDTPAVEEIRRVLSGGRDALHDTLRSFDETQLEEVVFPKRDWTLRTVLQVMCWHEPHHQGQAHLTWNMYNARS